MNNDPLSAPGAERPFAALREEIEFEELLLEELDAILGPRAGADDYDRIQFESTVIEVETHGSLAEDHPARRRAATIVEQLHENEELRQALFPILFAEGPGVIRDWVFIWRELEDERWRLVRHPSEREPRPRNP
jgi:hypothetical protein